MPFLELDHLQVQYERGAPVLKDFSLSVEKGELVSLLGPSGCGKTTTLRAVAGFIAPTRGSVRIGDRDYSRTPPNKRNIGLVFQSYALFPHLSVFDNVAFGLRMRHLPSEEIRNRVQAALKMVDLAGMDNRLSTQLSGGQRQRVALARAVVIRPDLLLLDEPLSNLDAKLRIGMRAELARLQRQLGITAIYVTHDQVEALSLSDRIVVMNKGRIEQMGKPEEIYQQPATPFVARFMGFDNHFSARVQELGPHGAIVQAGVQLLRAAPSFPLRVRVGDAVEALFRPENATLATVPGDNTIPGHLVFRTFQGSTAEYLVRSDLGEFTVNVSETKPGFRAGPVYVAISPEHLILEKHPE